MILTLTGSLSSIMERGEERGAGRRFHAIGRVLSVKRVHHGDLDRSSFNFPGDSCAIRPAAFILSVMPVRDLLLILGDQLDRESPLLASAERSRDHIWMAEVREESTHVWSHKARIALFLSAMRHFRDELRGHGWTVEYCEIGSHPTGLAGELRKTIRRLRPERVRVVEPGDYRVAQALRDACPEIDIVTDTHFLSTIEDFRHHARDRKQLRMEFFYREMRRRYGILMDGTRPAGGEWNYDAENRGAFGSEARRFRRPRLSPRTH